MIGRRSRALLYLGTPALLAAITWADYASGYELGLFVLYFVPVALAAWWGGRTPGVAYAVLAGACWYLSDLLSHHPYSNALLIYWETFMRLVSFLTLALTLSQIRANLRKREELLDVISHDLRGPLAAVVGQARLLERRAAADGFLTARVAAILRCASRMEAMIDDLLDSARSESSQLHLTLEPVDLGPYLAELVDRYAAVLEGGRVRLAVGAGPLHVRADPARLDRIVLNLLGNALKFSPPESAVDLGARREGGRVVLTVSDRGAGISAADLPHVFDRFYRGDRASSRAGLGLGLYSVRLLVEAHGGAVWAEAAPGDGTTFRVALPAAANDAPALRAGDGRA